MNRAVVLLSGGIDSATALAIARAEGRWCACLSFDYGQRHRFELEAAVKIARSMGVPEHRVVKLDLRAIGGSALTDSIDVPAARQDLSRDIPVTYVPARNLVFLSVAVAYAEVIQAAEIYIGVNAVDYSGYPDCRPEFIEAFERAAAIGTRAGTAGRGPRICAPLIERSKAEIIRRGVGLGVEYSLTHSCYDPDEGGAACGRCESCVLRARGFAAAGIQDPTVYSAGASAGAAR